MISRLSTRSLLSTATRLHATHSVQEIAPNTAAALTAPPHSSSDFAKFARESSIHSISRSLASSSVDAEDSHDDASGDESEGEDTVNQSAGLESRTRDQYIMKEARKRLAQEGAAPSSSRAFDSLERHLLSRTGGTDSMAPLSISLFNFHSQEFAKRLVKRSVGNLVLVESSLEHAMKAKDFARSCRKSGKRIEAFHADSTSLFGLDRKKKEEKNKGFMRKKKPPLFSFPDQLVARPKVDSEDGTVMPLILRRKESRPLTTVISPIIVCPLSVPSQLIAVQDALLRSLLQHHLKLDEKGLFTLGNVELVTYLHSEEASHLFSSFNPSLSFISHAARRRSQLMNTLFEIGQLDKPLSSLSFSPQNIPPSKKMSHAKKLKEVGFLSNRWFGCWLRPRSTVLCGGREIVNGVVVEQHDSLSDEKIVPSLPPSSLLTYTVWCETLGKMPATKKAHDVLSTFIPASISTIRSIIPSGAKIGEVTVEDSDAIFVEALSELNESPSVLQYQEKHLMKNKQSFVD